jgi:hypothetical protein
MYSTESLVCVCSRNYGVFMSARYFLKIFLLTRSLAWTRCSSISELKWRFGDTKKGSKHRFVCLCGNLRPIQPTVRWARDAFTKYEQIWRHSHFCATSRADVKHLCLHELSSHPRGRCSRFRTRILVYPHDQYER